MSIFPDVNIPIKKKPFPSFPSLKQAAHEQYKLLLPKRIMFGKELNCICKNTVYAPDVVVWSYEHRDYLVAFHKVKGSFFLSMFETVDLIPGPVPYTHFRGDHD